MKTMIPVVVVKIKDREPIEFYNAQIQVYGDNGEQYFYVKINDMPEQDDNFDGTLGVFNQRVIDYLYVKCISNHSLFEEAKEGELAKHEEDF